MPTMVTHERLDGSGNPDGKAGDQIPLGARVIAVCDAVTAMTSPRPSAPQLTVPHALVALRQGAGSQFDPRVVDALSELAVELIWPIKAAEDPERIRASHHPYSRWTVGSGTAQGAALGRLTQDPLKRTLGGTAMLRRPGMQPGWPSGCAACGATARTVWVDLAGSAGLARRTARRRHTGRPSTARPR
jgi:hypothetical protein